MLRLASSALVTLALAASTSCSSSGVRPPEESTEAPLRTTIGDYTFELASDRVPPLGFVEGTIWYRFDDAKGEVDEVASVEIEGTPFNSRLETDERFYLVVSERGGRADRCVALQLRESIFGACLTGWVISSSGARDSAFGARGQGFFLGFPEEGCETADLRVGDALRVTFPVGLGESREYLSHGFEAVTRESIFRRPGSTYAVHLELRRGDELTARSGELLVHVEGRKDEEDAVDRVARVIEQTGANTQLVGLGAYCLFAQPGPESKLDPRFESEAREGGELALEGVGRFARLVRLERAQGEVWREVVGSERDATGGAARRRAALAQLDEIEAELSTLDVVARCCPFRVAWLHERICDARLRIARSAETEGTGS
ncbi:MAG: hypothetical protein R3F34_16410 [Planctomycetota bacterium]